MIYATNIFWQSDLSHILSCNILADHFHQSFLLLKNKTNTALFLRSALLCVSQRFVCTVAILLTLLSQQQYQLRLRYMHDHSAIVVCSQTQFFMRKPFLAQLQKKN